METTSAVTYSIVQSRLVGDSKGAPFNDIEAVGRYPADLTIDMEQPIKHIEVVYGAVIDGITLIYHESEGLNEPTVSHGSQSNAKEKDHTLQSLTINLKPEEDIIAITGRHGELPPFGCRVLQLSFVLYNNKTGACRIETTANVKFPQSKTHGQPFRVTATGEIVAIGGYATNTNLSIGQAKAKLAEDKKAPKQEQHKAHNCGCGDQCQCVVHKSEGHCGCGDAQAHQDPVINAGLFGLTFAETVYHKA